MQLLPHYVLLLIFPYVLSTTGVHKRFEYKYSFKPPFLAQYDGSIPFWNYGGNAIASTDNLRVAPSLKSQKGAVWTKMPTNFNWWEVDLNFRISGRGRIGADGLAFWYTASPGAFDGTVYGSSDKWIGLGIFFDSFDNDNKHNNPYIMAIVNDGTKQFDHANDGINQMIGGCLRDFRNKPFSTRAKVEYFKNTLTVLFHSGNTNIENDFEVCIRVENVFLPQVGYFGVSAATGGLGDDHDVKHFLTHSLHPEDAIGGSKPIDLPAEDQQKLDAEFAEYQKKLDVQKEQYKKEHPDEQKDSAEIDDWYESDSQRELRQIFSVQNQMYDGIRVLSNKLDEVIGKQERGLSLLSSISSGAVAQIRDPGTGGSGVSDHLISNVMSSVLEVRNMVVEVQRKTENILTNQIKQPTAQVQSLGYDTSTLVSEVRDGINSLKKDLTIATQKINQIKNNPCETVRCVSSTTFFVFMGIQICLIFGYILYRNRQESQAKKFY